MHTSAATVLLKNILKVENENTSKVTTEQQGSPRIQSLQLADVLYDRIRPTFCRGEMRDGLLEHLSENEVAILDRSEYQGQ